MSGLLLLRAGASILVAGRDAIQPMQVGNLPHKAITACGTGRIPPWSAPNLVHRIVATGQIPPPESHGCCPETGTGSRQKHAGRRGYTRRRVPAPVSGPWGFSGGQ
jgi:hypothetical protein